MKKLDKDELISRYLYEVIRRLPENQKADIKKELETLIEDLLVEKIGDQLASTEDVKEVLINLGKPSDLAMKYRDGKKVLIGEEYYDTYCLVLKIVLLCAGIGTLIGAITSTIVMSFGITEGEIKYNQGVELFLQIPSVLVGAFAWVTIMFALVERAQVKINKKLILKPFNPDELPEITEKSILINRSGSIVGIVFLLIFGIFLCVTPNMIGVWIVEQGVANVISVLNLPVWQQIIPYIGLSVVLGILDRTVRLINGRYCIFVAVTTLVTKILNFIIIVFLFTNFKIWNPEFVHQLEHTMKVVFTSKNDLLTYWNTNLMNEIVIIIVGVGSAITCIKTIFYTIKANVTK